MADPANTSALAAAAPQQQAIPYSASGDPNSYIMQALAMQPRGGTAQAAPMTNTLADVGNTLLQEAKGLPSALAAAKQARDTSAQDKVAAINQAIAKLTGLEDRSTNLKHLALAAGLLKPGDLFGGAAQNLYAQQTDQRNFDQSNSLDIAKLALQKAGIPEDTAEGTVQDAIRQTQLGTQMAQAANLGAYRDNMLDYKTNYMNSQNDYRDILLKNKKDAMNRRLSPNEAALRAQSEARAMFTNQMTGDLTVPPEQMKDYIDNRVHELLSLYGSGSGSNQTPTTDIGKQASANAEGLWKYWAGRSGDGKVRNIDGSIADHDQWVADRTKKEAAKLAQNSGASPGDINMQPPAAATTAQPSGNQTAQDPAAKAAAFEAQVKQVATAPKGAALKQRKSNPGFVYWQDSKGQWFKAKQ